jgi:hypothetical protein
MQIAFDIVVPDVAKQRRRTRPVSHASGHHFTLRYTING